MARRSRGAGLGPRRQALGLRVAALALTALLVGLAVAVAAGSDRAHARRVAAPSAGRLAATTGSATGALAAAITPDPALVHDGDGIATVALADVVSTDVPVSRVRTAIRVPAPARVTDVRSASGWRCTVEQRGHGVSCLLAAARTSSNSVPSISLGVGATGRPYGTASLGVRGSWLQSTPDGRLSPQTSASRLAINERAPLSVGVRSTQKTVVGLVQGVPSVPTILEGSVGRRTPEPINFQWRQLCGPGPCPRVRWMSPTMGVVLDGQEPGASFIAPKGPQLLRFALTASDARGPVTATTTVRVVPDQIERINPGLTGAALARASLHSNEKPVTRLPLSKADQAPVSVAAPGTYTARVNGLVRLDARIRDQRVTRTSWAVAIGPRSMLAGAKRTATAISFRAPPVPGTYAVRMTARTATDTYSRDELIEVDPAVRPSADIASAGGECEEAFKSVLSAAQAGQQISIALPSGGTFTARPTNTEGTGCSATIHVKDGSTTLGSHNTPDQAPDTRDFELKELEGTITRGGLVITRGTLVSPEFWGAPTQSAADRNVRVVHGPLDAHAAQTGSRLEIPFQVPREGDLGIGLEIPLSNAGFGDLTGGISLNENALTKFPLSHSLPESTSLNQSAHWKMTKISLAVVPAARRFELTADAEGPKAIGGQVNFYGAVTFAGQVSATVTVSNLAVFKSADGQKVPHSVQGTLTLLPGQRFDPANPNATGSYFPVIDLEVSAEFSHYRPADNVTLSGRISWSSNGPLEVEGTLDTAIHGTPMRFTMSGSFTDASNWKLYAQFAPGGDGLPVGNPQLLRLKLLEGTLSRQGGALQFKLKGEAADIKAIDGVEVKSAKIEFTTACEFFQRSSTAASGGVCLLVEVTSALTVPGSTRPLSVGGTVKVNLTTGKFEASGEANLSPDDPVGSALGLHKIRMFVTNAGPPEGEVCKSVVRPTALKSSAGQLYYGLAAEGEARGIKLHFTGAYLGDHFCLGASAGLGRATDRRLRQPDGDRRAAEGGREAAASELCGRERSRAPEPDLCLFE